MHFSVSALHDGTVLSAYPIRKPSKQALRQPDYRIDAEGVARESRGAGRELSDVDNETRFRFQNIIATNLNTRRAIRSLVLPALAELLTEVRAIGERLDRIEMQASNDRTPVRDAQL